MHYFSSPTEVRSPSYDLFCVRWKITVSHFLFEFAKRFFLKHNGLSFFVWVRKSFFLFFCWKIMIFGFSSNSKSPKTILFWSFRALKPLPFDPAWTILSNTLLFISNGGQEPELWPVLCSLKNNGLSFFVWVREALFFEKSWFSDLQVVKNV